MSRFLDMALATGAAALTGPLVCAAALAIRTTDGAPVLFVQERVGKDREPFSVYKLRTMRDGRVTPVGAVLRDTGIDELPQLWNVLLGDMSLVGPRPLTRTDIARLGWDDARFDMRFSVRPGMTGTTQLGLSAQCDARISWVCDRHYVAHQSDRRDLGLLAASALCLLVGKARVGRWLRRQRRNARNAGRRA